MSCKHSQCSALSKKYFSYEFLFSIHYNSSFPGDVLVVDVGTLSRNDTNSPPVLDFS